MLTKEWPPDVYGGAGVHVEQLVTNLRTRANVDVQCFGAPRPDALAHRVPGDLAQANPALQALGIDVNMADAVADADVVHSHTWYTNLGGHIGGLLAGIPHVLTSHSLEPMRPWKAEQLGGGYRISSWIEQTSYAAADAIIAVSAGMAADILAAYPMVDPNRVHVVHNGIDTDRFRPNLDRTALTKYGIDSERPYVLFVGRITRQKGILHLIRAALRFDDDLQLVLCASAPDTPQIGVEISDEVENLRRERGAQSVVWVQDPVPHEDLTQLFTHCRTFACPSIYEPLGIVNLEAMACEAPVVASAVGGIPEVVQDGVTGILVPYDEAEPRAFEHALGDAINAMAADPVRAKAMGAAGRARAVAEFSWASIADQTLAVYETAIGQ
jgi:starch synthase